MNGDFRQTQAAKVSRAQFSREYFNLAGKNNVCHSCVVFQNGENSQVLIAYRSTILSKWMILRQMCFQELIYAPFRKNALGGYTGTSANLQF